MKSDHATYGKQGITLKSITVIILPLSVVNLLSHAMKKIECVVWQFAEGRYQGILIMGKLLRFSDAALMEHSTLAPTSALYGACCKIGFDMGYKRIITYTLGSEGGASLRASGFRFDGEAGGKQWTGKRRRDYYICPEEMKSRWIKERRC